VVLAWLGVILITLFLGITYLPSTSASCPVRTRPSCPSWPGTSSAPVGLLRDPAGHDAHPLLAANTSFADFPRLAFFLARDRFIPRQFATQGDRLSSPTASSSWRLAAACS
jgi:amino acid transporter